MNKYYYQLYKISGYEGILIFWIQLPPHTTKKQIHSRYRMYGPNENYKQQQSQLPCNRATRTNYHNKKEMQMFYYILKNKHIDT